MFQTSSATLYYILQSTHAFTELILITDTGPCVAKVLNGEKPGKNAKNIYNNNKTNAKNATNNAKNGDLKKSPRRDGSNSRKNSLTGSNSSREPSKSRGNSKSPSKRISRQNSKEEQPKQNGNESNLVNGDTNSQLEPVIERPSENGTSHEPEVPLTNGNHELEQQPESLASSGAKTPQREEIEEPSSTSITTEKPKESSKRPVSSGRSRSGSSRPITGYGKTRTSTSDEPTENGNNTLCICLDFLDSLDFSSC